jgi:hypothetical protein
MSLHDSRARAERAYLMRAVPYSWREICRALGYRSVGSAQLAVQRHIKRTSREPSDVSQRLAVESVQLTSRVLFDRFAVAADRGDDATLALLNRELRGNRDQLAKLLGLYAPDRAEVDVNVRQSPSQLLDEYRDKLLAIIDAEVIDEPKGIEK